MTSLKKSFTSSALARVRSRPIGRKVSLFPLLRYHLEIFTEHHYSCRSLLLLLVSGCFEGAVGPGGGGISSEEVERQKEEGNKGTLCRVLPISKYLL